MPKIMQSGWKNFILRDEQQLFFNGGYPILQDSEIFFLQVACADDFFSTGCLCRQFFLQIGFYFVKLS